MMMKKALARAFAVLAVAVLVTVVAACGGDDGDTGGDLQTRLTDMFREDDGLTPEEAECFAEFMIEEVDRDALNDGVDAGIIPEEAFAVMDQAFDQCFDFGGLFDDLENLDLDDFDLDDLDVTEPQDQ